MTEAPDIARLEAESRWVRALARHLVADAHEAEDLAQDALLAALGHRGPIASLRAFVATLMRRRALERWRGDDARRRREARAAHDERLPSTLDMLERASVQRDLVQAVLELEEPSRTTILWRFFEGLPPREIARRAGVPVATVHTRLQRGLARLRQRLAREHGPGQSWVMALLPLTSLPHGASPLGALLVKTSTQIAVAVTLVLGGALVAWRLQVDGARPGTPREERSALPELRSDAPPADLPLEGAREALSADTAEPAAEHPVVLASPPPPVAGPTRLVRGLVLDDLGRPLPGTRLATRPEGERFVSQAGGSFAVPLSDSVRSIVSDDPRYATVMAGAAGTRADSGAVVVLAPRIALAGVVQDALGQGLAGAEITVTLPRDFGTDFGLPLDGALLLEWGTACGTDGAFALADVPAVAGARLRAALGGFEARTIDLPARTSEDLVLVLERPRTAEERVRGLVRRADGARVPGARVAFGLATTVCDGDGRFELVAAPGESPAAVRALARGLAPAELRRAPGGSPWPAQIELVLGETLQGIAGHVLDAEGEPVSGARVWLDDPTWFGAVEGDVVSTEGLAARDDRRFWAYVETDAAGAFELEGLFPRPYRLRAFDARTLLAVTSPPIPPGTRDALLSLPADALFAHVTGRVVDVEGQGIADVSVVVQRMALTFEFPDGGTRDSFMPRPAVTTDADGHFTLEDVPREGVELFASGDSILFASRQVGPGLDPGDALIRAERRIHLQVELDAPFERADSLRVLDADGGPVLLRIMRGSTSQTNSVAHIENGRSHVLSLSERARLVVLYAHEVEVARLRLEPRFGEVNRLRW